MAAEYAPRIPVVPQRRRCWRDKLSHASFDDALAHAEHLRRLDRHRGLDRPDRCVVIYFCLLHQSWHVGHGRVGVPSATNAGGPGGPPPTTDRRGPEANSGD